MFGCKIGTIFFSNLLVFSTFRSQLRQNDQMVAKSNKNSLLSLFNPLDYVTDYSFDEMEQKYGIYI